MIEASYGRIAESNTAIIEMSAAAGITLVNESDRNPLHTTTYGVGELIRDAIKKGCRKFIVGIGEVRPTTEESVCSRLSATAF